MKYGDVFKPPSYRHRSVVRSLVMALEDGAGIDGLHCANVRPEIRDPSPSSGSETQVPVQTQLPSRVSHSSLKVTLLKSMLVQSVLARSAGIRIAYF